MSRPGEEQELAAWLGEHPDVTVAPLAGRTEVGGRRYRYAGLAINYYHTGTILLQGSGIGNVRFEKLNCKSCQGRPKIIQALNYMYQQGQKRLAKSE